MLIEEELSEQIIGSAIEVHKALGPGLLESAYEECFCHELGLRGLSFQRQVELPVQYKGVTLNCAYRMDVVIENVIIAEIKAVERTLPIHEAQLLTYLRLTGKRIGFVLNFNVARLRTGILRRVL